MKYNVIQIDSGISGDILIDFKTLLTIQNYSLIKKYENIKSFHDNLIKTYACKFQRIILVIFFDENKLLLNDHKVRDNFFQFKEKFDVFFENSLENIEVRISEILNEKHNKIFETFKQNLILYADNFILKYANLPFLNLISFLNCF